MNNMRFSGLAAAEHRLGHSPFAGLQSGLREAARAALRWADLLYQRARQRRALAHLDRRLLRDIGVTPEQAEREAARPFWQG